MSERPNFAFFPGPPGEPYRPCNGDEGEAFMSRWCGCCERDRAFREGSGDSCPIVADTMIYDVEDPEYPKQWRYDASGQPECAGFVPERPDGPE
jgi:hypothetical protein